MTDLVAFSAPQEGAVYLTHATRADLLKDVEAHMLEKRGFAVATLNLDHIVKLKRDPVFRAAYLAQTHVVADGNPIVWLSGMAGREVELIPGSDAIRPIVEIAARTGTPMSFLGSTEETLEAAGEALKREFPGLQIAAAIAPPYGFDPDGESAAAALEEIEASGAGLCLLALGAPKQEQLAARGLERAPSVGFVSIGAGLDFISGQQKRAPVWVRKLALEWLWRMLSNPARLAGRYLSCIVILPGLVRAAKRQGSEPS
ncbi:MAG: WecB/TagA/CpsF family glycosyltransferase [Paracoccaceae bacterium]